MAFIKVVCFKRYEGMKESPENAEAFSGLWGAMFDYTDSWKVRLMTSNCCSRLRRLKFTA